LEPLLGLLGDLAARGNGDWLGGAPAAASNSLRTTSHQTKSSFSSPLICTAASPEYGDAQYKFRDSNENLLLW